MNRRRIAKTVMLALVTYLASATALLAYVRVRYALLDLSQLEPRSDMSDYNPADVGLDPGVYGRGHPLTVNTLGSEAFRTRINRFGSRNLFEVQPDASNNVLLLGDSFFFGLLLHDEQTVAHHLGQVDPGHHYINLAVPGYNVYDSALRYADRRSALQAPPAAVVLQVLPFNDVGPERHMERIMTRQVEFDSAFILPPVSLYVTRERLTQIYWSRAWQLVHGNLDRRRLRIYLEQPVRRIAARARADGAQLLVISYNLTGPFGDKRFAPYVRQLGQLCRSLGVSFARVKDLVPGAAQRMLPDGHPSDQVNRDLARALGPLLRRALDRR